MSEIFNKAVEQADKLSTQDNARAVLDELYGKTEEAYEKFEKLPIAEQILASMTPGIGNIISAKEVDVFGGRAGEAFEEAKYGKAAGYGALTGLAALGTLPGVGILGRGAKAAIRSGTKLLDEPVKKGLKALDEPVKVEENIFTSRFMNDDYDEGEKWLKETVEYIESKGKDRYGNSYLDTPTGRFQKEVRMPVSELKKLKGMRGEQKNVRQKDLDWLVENMGKTGKLPLHEGKEYAPYIIIDYKGIPKISEGSHRIMAADKLGMKDLPVEIRYFDGGELKAQGIFNPENIRAGEKGLKALDEPVKVVDTTIVEKKLSPTEVEFFEDMLRAGDPYDFKAVVPSAVMRTGEKGEKYLRAEGEKGLNDLFEFLNPSLESGHQWFLPGEMPSQMRNYKWFDRFKNVDETVKKGIVERSGLADPKIMKNFEEGVELKKAERVEKLGYDPSDLPKNILDKATEYSKLRPKTDDEALKAFEEWRSFINNPSNFNVVKPILKMPEGFTPSNETIARALSKDGKLNKSILNETQVKIFDKKGNYKLLDKIPEGHPIAARLDIPAYTNKDTWVVTLHDGFKKSGKVSGYSSTARLTDVNFGTSPNDALKIARKAVLKVDEKTGEPIKRMGKSTIARMNGKWKNHEVGDVQKQAKNILNSFDEKAGKFIVDGEEWVQVGMNPYRHSFFYDKVTMQPIKSADEVIQLGPLVLAKKVKYDDLLNYKTNEGLIFKQGGQIATGLAGLGENIVYRQGGGDLGDWEGADIVGGSFTDYAGDDHGGFADVDIGVDPGQRTDDEGGLRDPTITELVTGKGVTGNPKNIDGEELVAFANNLTEQTGIEVVPFYDAIFNSRAGRIALDAMLDRDNERLYGPEHWNPYDLKEGFVSSDFNVIQAAIDNGDLQGIGIDFANAMEDKDLNTFGKNMRSSMEAWTPGKGLSRDSYDPGVLIGTAQFTDVASEKKKALAAEEFMMMLHNAKGGETVSDISAQYKEAYGEAPPVESFGYNVTSNAQAKQVADSFDEARSKGALQGLSMMLGFGMTTIPSIISAGYTLDEGITKTDNVFSKGISQLKEAVSPLLPDFLTDKETVDLSDLPSEAYIPYGKEEEIDKSFLEQAGEKIGEIAGYAEWLTSPVEKGIQSLLNWGGENLNLISVPDYSSEQEADTAREKSLSEDSTFMDSFRNLMPSKTPSKRPLPSADIYGGENVTEAVQSPSIETAALPVAPEEDIANIYGAMSGYFSQPKLPRKNVFTDALLENIYQV